MGSLRNFQLNQKIRQKDKPSTSKEKEKTIAFKSTEKEASHDEDGDNEMTMLAKNFQKYIKKIGNKKFNGKPSKGNPSSLKPFQTNKKGIQCRECEGFGHIQSECANTLKKNKKCMIATWSDNDSESSEDEEGNVALTSILPVSKSENEKIVCLNNVSKDEENSDSDESELNDESLSESYKKMYGSWVKVCSENRSLVSKNKDLSFKIKQLTDLNENFEKRNNFKEC